jgi:hypothetical protein
MAKGIYTNEELVDTLISDLNSLLKNAAGGQYIQACVIVTGMSQKMINLKSGIKNDLDNKNRIIEELKEQLRQAGAEVNDMSIEEFMKKGGDDNGCG